MALSRHSVKKQGAIKVQGCRRGRHTRISGLPVMHRTFHDDAASQSTYAPSSSSASVLPLSQREMLLSQSTAPPDELSFEDFSYEAGDAKAEENVATEEAQSWEKYVTEEVQSWECAESSHDVHGTPKKDLTGEQILELIRYSKQAEPHFIPQHFYSGRMSAHDCVHTLIGQYNMDPKPGEAHFKAALRRVFSGLAGAVPQPDDAWFGKVFESYAARCGGNGVSLRAMEDAAKQFVAHHQRKKEAAQVKGIESSEAPGAGPVGRVQPAKQVLQDYAGAQGAYAMPNQVPFPQNLQGYAQEGSGRRGGGAVELASA
ncbi:unnamed protein product, partial [Symbiodinium sp. KB8]